AAILLTSLKYFETWTRKRLVLASRYYVQLTDLPIIQLPRQHKDVRHVYHLYCIQSDARKEIMAYLKKQHIQTGIYYPQCMHLQISVIKKETSRLLSHCLSACLRYRFTRLYLLRIRMR